MKTIFSFLFSFSFSLGIFGYDDTCQNTSSYHLNENFPAKAVFIGASRYKAEDLKTLILSVFKKQGKKSPVFVLLGSPRDHIDWIDEVEKITSSPSLRLFFRNRIREKRSNATWIQDIFESYYDSKTKKNLIRLVKGYKLDEEQHFKVYSESQKSISSELVNLFGDNINFLEPINNSEPLVASKNGQKGGNIESTNEGHCLIGDSDLTDAEWEILAEQTCKDKRYAIKLSTSWLPATHIDELIKQLPTDKGLAGCNPKFAIISPRKGIEILRQYKDDPFWDVNSSIQESKSRFDLSHTLNYLCAKIVFNEGAGQRISKYKIENSNNYQSLIPSAGEYSFKLPFLDTEVENLYDRCLSITNKEVVTMYEQDERFRQVTHIFETFIHNAKTRIIAKYHETNPSCKVEFIDLPVLMSVKKERYFSHDYDFTMLSSSLLLPNPINSLQVGNQLFIPNTQNSHLNDYVSSVYKTFSLEPTFLDTFDIHMSGGNIHCTTQTVRYCK